MAEQSYPGKYHKVDLEKWLTILSSVDTDIEMLPDSSGFFRTTRALVNNVERIGCHFIHLVEHGRYQLIQGERAYAIHPGTLLWGMPGASFRLERPMGVAHFYTKFNVVRKRTKIRLDKDLLVIPNAWDVRGHLQDLISETQVDMAFRARKVSFLLGLISTEAFRLENNRSEMATLSNRQRIELEQMVADNLGARLTPADLAKAIHLSPGYFRKVFKHTYAMSPRTWLMRQRLASAEQRLLESTDSIQQIAFDLGYENPFLFTRQFKQVYQLSPRQYRKQ